MLLLVNHDTDHSSLENSFGHTQLELVSRDVIFIRLSGHDMISSG